MQSTMSPNAGSPGQASAPALALISQLKVDRQQGAAQALCCSPIAGHGAVCNQVRVGMRTARQHRSSLPEKLEDKGTVASQCVQAHCLYRKVVSSVVRH